MSDALVPPQSAVDPRWPYSGLSIPSEEFQERVETIFDEADATEDRALNFREFQYATLLARIGAAEKLAPAVLAATDANEDGLIDAGEARAVTCSGAAQSQQNRLRV